MTFLLMFVLIIWVFRLYRRLKKYEKALTGEPREKTPNITRDAAEDFLATPAQIQAQQARDLSKELLEKNKKTEETTCIARSHISFQDIFRKLKHAYYEEFKLHTLIKENWIGIFGSIAIVIGAVFFGLAAEIMQKPLLRVSAMLLFSGILLGFWQKFRRNEKWSVVCSWLRSIAGAIILFATLGAGSINGLKFIDSNLYRYGFLCCGIAVNIWLSILTMRQSAVSFHVVLSIIAFCVAPQSVLFLPIGALVILIGLGLAYRAKWDLQIVLLVLSFAILNSVWTFSLKGHLLLWMHYLAIGCSILVALMAGLIHYTKNYRVTSHFECWSFLAHVSNWTFLAYNVLLHAQFLKWTSFLLIGASIFAFLLARQAKRNGMLWLYYTDSIFAQMIMIAAIACWKLFSPTYLDLSIFALIEIMIFNAVMQKEHPILRAGYALQLIAYCLAIYFVQNQLDILNHKRYGIDFRLYLIAFLSWGFNVLGVFKDYIVDDWRFLLFGDIKFYKNPLSLMNCFGAIFFLGAYYLDLGQNLIQVVFLANIMAIALWNKFREDISWNIILLTFLVAIHLTTWFIAYEGGGSLRFDVWGVLLLDLALIFGNLLHFKLWKSISHLLVYVFFIDVLQLTFAFARELSSLIIGVLFLGYSLVALEISKALSTRGFYLSLERYKIQECFLNSGIVLVLLFVYQFVTVHLQVFPLYNGVPLRYCVEFLGLATIAFWVFYCPQQLEWSKFAKTIQKALAEIFLFFMTLVVLVEVLEAWRPIIWVAIAIALLWGTFRYNLQSRFYLYSWLYFLASIALVAFSTNTLCMPKLFMLERYNIPAIFSLILQFYYAYMLQKRKTILFLPIMKKLKSSYAQPIIIALLPVFLGIAVLVALNYDRALLTLLWAMLACSYLAFGLIVKSKKAIVIAMTALAFCSARLIFLDLMRSSFVLRAILFLGVGVLMLGISILYKKYQHRIEIHENN